MAALAVSAFAAIASMGVAIHQPFRHVRPVRGMGSVGGGCGRCAHGRVHGVCGRQRVGGGGKGGKGGKVGSDGGGENFASRPSSIKYRLDRYGRGLPVPNGP